MVSSGAEPEAEDDGNGTAGSANWLAWRAGVYAFRGLLLLAGSPGWANPFEIWAGETVLSGGGAKVDDNQPPAFA